MVRNIRSHTEERGEMSLSLLAYSVAGDSDHSDVTKLDLNYTIMNKCHSVIKDINKDIGTTPPKRFHHDKIHTNNEVQLISNQLLVNNTTFQEFDHVFNNINNP
eukprot:Phypoly_transcript_20583.p1 GENE.Phypoly_transcript_20583~~Phypoly_transcript_20583.p1  ORF type:complete len:104 (+),score=11.38 Phypoly_transcript_20583:366-677(+)